MSIATRTGDEGITGLMYNRRVPKSHPRVEAYGSVDELNAFLGLAKAELAEDPAKTLLHAVQKELVLFMGELAVDPADAERYRQSPHARPDDSMLERLDIAVKAIEARSIRFDGWATPGANPLAARFDVARTVCRRAERTVVRLGESEPGSVNPLAIRYLNRLADLLWLMARQEESRH